MSISKAMTVFLFALTFLLSAPSLSTAQATSCSDVYTKLFPCLGYFQGGGHGDPPPECCGGIKSAVAMARTAAERRSTCTCLKIAATGASGSNVALAGALPAKCGVSVPYKISPSTDCTKVR